MHITLIKSWVIVTHSVIVNYGSGSEFTCMDKDIITYSTLYNTFLTLLSMCVLCRYNQNLVLIKRNHVIGGICFRAFVGQNFAEITFCAIAPTEQFKVCAKVYNYTMTLLLL